MLTLYIDGDACPVKAETIKVAHRHGLEVYIVSNAGMRPIRHPKIHMILVESGADIADDWIAERASKGDICITADILLADRCLKNGAAALNPTGHAFTPNNIGNAIAGRSISAHLRELGEATHNAPFSKQDRSRFLQNLEQTIQSIKRG
jgi:uncharacterized protein YaiI (UPF0178 family)